MEMITVASSTIDSLGYDNEAASLVVVFRDGHVYEFHLVPPHVFEDFLVAPSKGSYFNQHLKNGPYGARITRRA